MTPGSQAVPFVPPRAHVMEIAGPVPSLTMLLASTGNAALDGVGACVMAGAVLTAEVLIAGEELAHRMAAGLKWL